MRSRGMIIGVTIKKIESRTVDQGFRLQAGCKSRFSAAARPMKGGSRWVSIGGLAA